MEGKGCITYEDGTSDLDENAAIRVAGHGVNGRDLVFYPLEGQTLEIEQKCNISLAMPSSIGIPC